MKNKRVLVTAANGNTGFPTALELLKMGFKIKALVRNQNAKHAKILKNRGAEIFVGDMHDIRDYQRALVDVDRVYFCAPVRQNHLFKAVAFMIAAEEAQVEHVVYMTQWLSSKSHPSINTKEQWLADQLLKFHQKVNYTIINPGLFAFTYFFAMEPIAQLGLMPNFVKGEGNNPIISELDIAKVVAHILKNPAPHIGRTYHPTGPKVLSMDNVRVTFEKILGRRIKFMSVGEKLLLKSFKANQTLNAYEASNVFYYLKELEANTFGIGGATNVVKEITGEDPEDFESIARRYIENDPVAKRSLGNKLKAVKNFLKIVFTPMPNRLQYERDQEFPLLMHGMNGVQEDEEWVKTHGHQKPERRQHLITA